MKNEEEKIQETEIESEDDAVREETENDDSNHARRWLIPAIAGGLILVLLVGIVLWRRGAATAVKVETPAAKNETGKVKFLMEQQWLIQMKLARAEETTAARQVTATGRVTPAPNRQAVVAPPVGGIITGGNLPILGQFVSQGQTVAVVQQTATSAESAQVRAAIAQVEAAEAQTRAQIQTQNAQLQTQNAQAQIENARLEAEKRTVAGQVETARVRLDQTRREAERARRLYAGKALSQKQLQAAESELNTAQADYDSISKRRDALGEARPITPVKPLNPGNFGGNTKQIGANSSYTVRAPFGGYVTKVNKATGEQVAPGEAIVEITNLDIVHVEVPIFERDLNRIVTGGGATFTTSAFPEREFRGAVEYVGAVIDEQTRAANVHFQVPNDGRALRLGMQANVRLDAEETVTAMMIPRSAILDNEGKKIIYVLLSGEEFERREVTLGDEYGEKVAVLSGLEKGERVVTQGAYQIRLQELRPADAGVHSHET